MRTKSAISFGLVCVLLLGTTVISARAEEGQTIFFECREVGVETEYENYLMDNISPIATESFNLSVPANAQARANGSFPLAAGETVTIKASYSPFSASVDFGLIAPDGTYYYFNVTSGSVDKTIQVSTSGNYTFQIRNHSATEVQASGFVNY